MSRSIRAFSHKIALFCNVKPDCVIENMTIPVLYEAPIMLEKNNFSSVVCRELNLKTKEPDMTEWSRMVEKYPRPQKDRHHRPCRQIYQTA